MRIAAVLSTMPAAVILSMPVACWGAAQSTHPTFHDAVWQYYRTANPACGMTTDGALAARVAARDKRFELLSARIAASPLAKEFRAALDDARKKQAGMAAVIDCAAPTVAGSRTVVDQSLIALDRLERAWRDALKD